MARHFDFAFEDRYRRPARLFGITESRTGIDVDDEALEARFGPWHVRVARADIADVTITGPYAFLKTAGPAHLGVTDRSLTFATNSRRGVELRFHTPIRGLDPIGLLRHPSLTLTAADCDALAAELRP